MIEIKQLCFSYPNRTAPALRHINLTIPQGSLFGLLGPNGAGKSTLLNILSGLHPYTDGSIVINNTELTCLAPAKKPFCALIPQELAFYPTLTARENLAFFAATLGMPSNTAKKDIDRCLELTCLSHHADKQAATFSGGLKRRLNIAIGLLNSPSLVFLDEPTVGIDAQSRHFILQSIRNINASGTTIIYTSHYMEEVENLCDRIAILDHGEILLAGELQTILSHTHKLTVSIHQALSDQQLLSLQKNNLQVEARQKTLIIDIQRQEDITFILSMLDQWQISIDRISYGAQDLEQLFLDLTDRRLRD